MLAQTLRPAAALPGLPPPQPGSAGQGRGAALPLRPLGQERRRPVFAVPGTVPFGDATQAWFWTVAALAARRNRHDVLLVVNVANAPFCLLGRATGQPVVLNVDGQEWLRDKWGPLARGVFRASARMARHCANALIADCAAMGDVYRDEFGAPTTVIPYCQPDLPWHPDPDAVRRHGLEPGGYLLIAGRHNPENNLDRVAESISASRLDLPLVVLGQPPRPGLRMHRDRLAIGPLQPQHVLQIAVEPGRLEQVRTRPAVGVPRRLHRARQLQHMEGRVDHARRS